MDQPATSLNLQASFKGLDFSLLGFMDEEVIMVALDTHQSNLKRSKKKFADLQPVHQAALKNDVLAKRQDLKDAGIILPDADRFASLFSHVSISDIWWVKGRKGDHAKSMFHFLLRLNLHDVLLSEGGKLKVKFLSLEYASGKDIEGDDRNWYLDKVKAVKTAVRGAQLADEELRKGQAVMAENEKSIVKTKEAIHQQEANQKNMQEALERNAENERKTKAALENQVDMQALAQKIDGSEKKLNKVRDFSEEDWLKETTKKDTKYDQKKVIDSLPEDFKNAFHIIE